MVPNTLREKLNRNAKKYYIAHKNDNDELREEAIQNLNIDSFGADCVGSGTGRNVFDMRCLDKPGYIVKLAKPHPRYDGRKQNKREIELYYSIGDEEKKRHLVPILAYGTSKYWLIMEKGSNDFKIDYDRISDIKYDLESHIWEDDIIKENIVEINGKLKLCDYGTKSK